MHKLYIAINYTILYHWLTLYNNSNKAMVMTSSDTGHDGTVEDNQMERDVRDQ